MTQNPSPYFSQDFLEFFKELAANNHKDWFDANRKRYEKSVKAPFKDFISDLIENIRSIDPSIQITANHAIFRINRDIRFSPNKEPYKLDRSAVISRAGRKDHSVPGFYISLGPEFTQFGGGAYFLKSDQLARVRAHIKNNMKRFEKLVSDKTFTQYFDGIKGEEHKRLPKELKEAGEKQALLYKKQMYYMTQHEPALATSPALMQHCMDHYKAALPLQEFLTEALE